MIAALIAICAGLIGAVSQTLTGRNPAHKTIFTDLPLFTLPIIAVGGLFLGGVGVLFNKSLVGALNMVDRIPSCLWWITATAVGGLSGFLLVAAPQATVGREGLVREMPVSNGRSWPCWCFVSCAFPVL